VFGTNLINIARECGCTIAQLTPAEEQCKITFNKEKISRSVGQELYKHTV
jgi:hypothetical protein